MSLRRLVWVCCAIAASAALSAAAQAQATVPRWYVQETGAQVPLDVQSGLVEPASPETIQSLGGLKVFGRANKPSECLAKDRETISDPSEKSRPGTGNLEELELLCEKSTGFGNYAEPNPCAGGEPFEVKAVGLPWSSSLEIDETEHSQKYTHIRDAFTNAAIEVVCLVSKAHDEYRGALSPEVALGKLNFRGTESGELLDANGYHIYFTGLDYIAPAKYKAVRALANYEEKLAITSITPSSGPSVGGATVTVKGTGFGLGGETEFTFGKAFGSETDCLLTTECTVVTPNERAGTVRVIATVGSKKSAKNNRGDEYTFE